MRILIVEDDPDLVGIIRETVEKEGFAADSCTDGEEGLAYLPQGSYDLAILDRMLPGLDGISVLRGAQARGVMTPVIITTALGRIDDRIEGLDSGADDYLVKPFDVRELQARVRALTRRPHEIKAELLCYDEIQLDSNELRLRGPLGSCSLSKREADLLSEFFQNAGRTLSREFLFTRMWGIDGEVEDASLDTYIHYVRRHLEAVSRRVVITTLRRVGYKMETIDG